MNFLTSLIPIIGSLLFGKGGQKTPTQTQAAFPPELQALLRQMIGQQTALQPLKNSANQFAYSLLPSYARNSSTTPQAPTGGYPGIAEARPSGVGISTPSGSADYDAAMRTWLQRMGTA